MGELRWSLVVPVKRLTTAKTRLAGFAGDLRADLALAVASDTVRAAVACPRVAEVVVVTDEARARDELAALGARVVADAPDAGLNPALRHGAEVARATAPAHGIGALSADLPALRPEELGRALDAAAGSPAAFVADAGGTGTTLLTARPGVALAPAFGPRSRARHRAAGAVEIDVAGIATVRRDVDTEVDLWDAERLGLGPRSAAVLTEVRRRARPVGR